MKPQKRGRVDCDDQSVTKFFKPSSSHNDRNAVITNAITKYLIASMKPIAEVESEPFIQMWSEVEPTYAVPTRKTMRGYIQTCCDVVRGRIMNFLRCSPYCAAQCDIWSSRRMHGYFGLCLTSVTEDGLQNTRLVACRRFKGAHTAQNISSMFSDLVQEFGVEDKINAIVTDNASNMVKAFKQDAGDNLQTTLEVQPGFVDVDDDSEMIGRVAINWAELEDEASVLIPPRYGCFAHILQLVVKDGLAEATTKIRNLLQKCSSIVASLHKSCKATELLEENKVPQIHTPNATRWNSKYEMIRSRPIIDAEQRCGGMQLLVCS